MNLKGYLALKNCRMILNGMWKNVTMAISNH